MHNEVDVSFFCSAMVVRGTRVFVELLEGDARQEYERLAQQAAAGWGTTMSEIYLLRDATVYCGGVVTKAASFALKRDAVLGGMRGAVIISMLDATHEFITDFV